MIEEITGRPEGTLEFRVTGHVSGDDYARVVSPAIDRALEDGGRVRVLMQFGPGFEGYNAEAAWDDAKLGLRHWRGFDRVAVVTDTGWLRGAVRGMGLLMPCPVMVFGLEELDDARRWLQESLGTAHLTEIGDRHLMVALHGKLDTDSIADAEKDLDGFIARAGGLELLLDLRDFDGWQGLGALRDHFGLIRDHYRVPAHVAVVGDQAWQRLAEQVMSRFSNAEVRFYRSAQFDVAKAWIETRGRSGPPLRARAANRNAFRNGKPEKGVPLAKVCGAARATPRGDRCSAPWVSRNSLHVIIRRPPARPTPPSPRPHMARRRSSSAPSPMSGRDGSNGPRDLPQGGGACARNSFAVPAFRSMAQRQPDYLRRAHMFFRIAAGLVAPDAASRCPAWSVLNKGFRPASGRPEKAPTAPNSAH